MEERLGETISRASDTPQSSGVSRPTPGTELSTVATSLLASVAR